MKLILVRHGQTIENASRRIQGHKYGTLSKLGKQQAESVAIKLAKENFDIIYTSDLKRCIDTANVIHKYHKNIPLILRTEIREFSFGVLEGLPAPKFKRVVRLGIRLSKILPYNFLGIESHNSVLERIIPFINHLYQKHKNDTVLIVTHGGPIRIIKAAVEGLPQRVDMDLEVPNCSVWRLNITKPL